MISGTSIDEVVPPQPSGATHEFVSIEIGDESEVHNGDIGRYSGRHIYREVSIGKSSNVTNGNFDTLAAKEDYFASKRQQ